MAAKEAGKKTVSRPVERPAENPGEELEGKVGDKPGERAALPRFETGLVMDHITAGRFMEVLKALDISTDEGQEMWILVSVPSKKLGRKDIIKLPNMMVADPAGMMARVRDIAPNMTLDVIKDGRIVGKFRKN